MKVSASWVGALSLRSYFKMHLQKGSIFCISERVFLQEDALAVSVFDVGVDLTSEGGVVSVDVNILLWVWVAEPSGVDVTNMLIRALEVTGVSLTSTNYERQSAALLWAPDIHSKVMSCVVSSIDLLFTLLCHNYLLVIAPGTLGVLPVSSLSQVSKQGWRKGISKCHGV